jgi:hypothetical protein
MLFIGAGPMSVGAPTARHSPPGAIGLHKRANSRLTGTIVLVILVSMNHVARR